ncbi:MAG: hemolysin-type calcium-binding region, partial [Gammaproteobacteria bacterium]|nr:hemolysin-type calcium-binding region [Gammaproteobacteria bacterium]
FDHTIAWYESVVTTTLDGTPTFTEGGAAVVLDADVDVSDAELDALNSGNGDYHGASVTLVRNGGANAEDVFSKSGLLGVLTESGALVYNGTTIGTVTTNSAGTLVLTFNTNATSALVDSTLQSIAYSNSSDNPPTSAQIDWSFDDGNTSSSQGTGGALQATGSTTVSITAVNDEPTLTATGSDPTFTEGDSAVGLFTGTAVSTVESGQTITGLTFTVTNVTDTGNEQITIDGETITLDDSESGSTADFSYSVSVSGTTATVTLSGGTASTVSVVTDIDNATYINNSQDPTDANRVVTITAVVDSGGTANGGDDTGAPVAVSTVNVNPVNDAVDMTVSGNTVLFTEDAGATSSLFSSSIDTIETTDTITQVILTMANVESGDTLSFGATNIDLNTNGATVAG